MKRWWLVLALMLSVGVNLGLLASRLLPSKGAPAPVSADAPPARPPGDSPRRPMPPVVERMADELGLEGERREQFIALQRQFFRATMEAGARHRRWQARLREALTAPEPDRRAVDEALEQVNAARGDLERAFVDNLFGSRELLDPRQTRLFMRFIGHLRQAREELDRRGPRRPGPPLAGPRGDRSPRSPGPPTP